MSRLLRNSAWTSIFKIKYLTRANLIRSIYTTRLLRSVQYRVVSKFENALSCNDCFRSYFDLVDYIHCRDHNPRDIRHLYYDVLKERMIRLTIVNEDPVEEAAYIYQYTSNIPQIYNNL